MVLATAGIPDWELEHREEVLGGGGSFLLLTAMIVSHFPCVQMMFGGAGSSHCLPSLSFVVSIVPISLGEPSFSQFSCKMPKHSG